MDRINLSIDELIYCLYAEGYFEQGRALKDAILSELTEDQFEISLEVSCRSLLSKEYIEYDEGKFNVVDSVKKIIKFISFADFTYQASKTLTHEVLTVHNKDNEYVLHEVELDGQIHKLCLIERTEAIDKVAQFFNVKNSNTSSFTVAEDQFEKILNSFDNIELKFDLPLLSDNHKNLYSKLENTKGFMNSLLVLSYSEKNEPIAQDILLFTATEEHNFGIVKEDNDDYTVYENSISIIESLIK